MLVHISLAWWCTTFFTVQPLPDMRVPSCPPIYLESVSPTALQHDNFGRMSALAHLLQNYHQLRPLILASFLLAWPKSCAKSSSNSGRLAERHFSSTAPQGCRLSSVDKEGEDTIPVHTQSLPWPKKIVPKVCLSSFSSTVPPDLRTGCSLSSVDKGGGDTISHLGCTSYGH